MTTTSSGAVGFAPVGTFVKDLASELGKAPATLVAYLKKHLPATLTKRKNANNRLANFVTEDGVAGLRAHYTPTVAPAAFESELQRLREENARLRALLTDDPTESIESLEQKRKALDEALEGSEQRREETKECLARAEITLERLEYVAAGLNGQTQNIWRKANDDTSYPTRYTNENIRAKEDAIKSVASFQAHRIRKLAKTIKD